MLEFLKVAGIAIIIFFIIDIAWLSLIAKKLYAKELKNFLSPKTNWIVAIIFLYRVYLRTYLLCY